jgi:hypothetical protein
MKESSTTKRRQDDMKLMTTLAILTFACGSAFGAVLVAESFEGYAVYSGYYTDTGDPAVDHDLVNNTDQPLVDIDTADAWYFNTRDDVGLTDGDYCGVTDYAGTVGSWVDGSQGYQMSDTDGAMTLTFDHVPGATHCSFWLFIQETGWETSPADAIVITYGTTVFLDTTGQDIDDLGIEGMWMYFFAPIDGSGQLTFTLDSNSGSEAMFIDHVLIADDSTIPNEDATWGEVKTLFR